MANELIVTVSAQFAKGGVAARPIGSGPLSINVAGSKFVSAVQNITTTEVAIGIGGLGTLGYAVFHNLDATNFLTIRMATAVTTGLKLKPNEWSLVRLGGNAPFAIADTANCLLEYWIVED